MIVKETIQNNKELLYYLIGLISSDGYLSESRNRIEISLVLSDLELLEKISLLIFGESKIIIDKNFNKNGRCRLFLYGKEIVNLFKTYGITQNKSKTLKLNYEIFEKEYIWHFIRGYFDGDGTYYTESGRLKHNVVIKCDGTYHTMHQFQKFFQEAGIKSSLKKLKEITSFDYTRLSIHTTDLSIKAIQLIYKNSTIYLDRKYQKIKKII